MPWWGWLVIALLTVGLTAVVACLICLLHAMLHFFDGF